MRPLRRPDGYELSADPDRIDLDRVYEWLSTDSYWAAGRARDVVERSIAGSLIYGVYEPAGQQVAVARAVTDRATFGWLCDVYVDRAHRKLGLGGWLVTAVRDHLRSLGVPRLVLTTADAHEVYGRAGFVPLAEPYRWMEIDNRPRQR